MLCISWEGCMKSITLKKLYVFVSLIKLLTECQGNLEWSLRRNGIPDVWLDQ